MSEYRDFTSLPKDQENQFVIYEKRTVEASKKALTIGLITSAVFGILVVVIVFSFEPPKKGHHLAGDDLGLLERKTPKKEDADKDKESAEEAQAEDSAEVSGNTPEGSSGDTPEGSSGEASEEAAGSDTKAEPEAEPADGAEKPE